MLAVGRMNGRWATSERSPVGWKLQVEGRESRGKRRSASISASTRSRLVPEPPTCRVTRCPNQSNVVHDQAQLVSFGSASCSARRGAARSLSRTVGLAPHVQILCTCSGLKLNFAKIFEPSCCDGTASVQTELILSRIILRTTSRRRRRCFSASDSSWEPPHDSGIQKAQEVEQVMQGDSRFPAPPPGSKRRHKPVQVGGCL